MTAQFRGRHSVRLDPKGRFILPSLLREAQKSKNQPKKFFITNNIYKSQSYLDVFSEKEWLSFEKKISEMPSMNQDIQAFRRFYLGSAVPVSADLQGRLLIPQELREYAGLNEDLIVLGVGSKFEIWDAKKWAKFQGDVQSSYEQILATVSSFESGKK